MTVKKKRGNENGRYRRGDIEFSILCFDRETSQSYCTSEKQKTTAKDLVKFYQSIVHVNGLSSETPWFVSTRNLH